MIMLSSIGMDRLDLGIVDLAGMVSSHDVIVFVIKQTGI